jgi:outer membrane lipoprotein SlyB
MKNLLLLIFILLAASCAPISQYEPIIDTQGHDFTLAKYQKDLRECRAYAARISPADQAMGNALAGAAFGAAIGAILGTGFDSIGQSAAIGAGMGGVSGGAQGATSAIEKQQLIIKNCLRGRGYAVLE